jgi:RNA polymerase sigma-70 factor (ECF subfamily)
MGDVPIRVSIDELLVHAAWVQSLARRLVRDEATALDIVQQTWTAGVRSPPSDRARIKGWLARVVRNFAREKYRIEGSRAAREARVARPEAVMLPPDALIARAEATQELAEAVAQLSEPYRSTILRRYYQGLTAREIADQEKIPVETVRTRLKRGVDALRETLRDRDGDGWALALVPLIRHDAGVSAVRPFRVARRARAVRNATLVAAASIALVAVVVWIAIGDGKSKPSAVGGAGAAAAPSSGGARADDAGAAASTKPGARPSDEKVPAAATTDAPSKPAATVPVRIAFEADAGVAPTAVQIVATPMRVGTARARAWRWTFDVAASGGSIELPRTSPIGTAISAWDVRVEHPELFPVHAVVELPAAAGGETKCALRLTTAGVLLGVVRAPRPAAECAPYVAAFVGEAPAEELVDQASVGADGEFRLRLAPERPHRVVVAALGARPVVFVAAARAREIRRVDPVALEEGGAVFGHAEGFDGRPAVGAIVRVLGTFEGRSWPLGPYSVSVGADDADWTIVETTTDAAGRFRVAGLRAAPYRASVVEAGVLSDRLPAVTQEVVPGGAELRFVTTAGAVAVRTLRDGAPLAATELLVVGSSGGATVTTDAEGRATLYGTPGASYELRVRTPGGAAQSAARMKVTAPALGSRRIETFETAAAPARLALTLKGPVADVSRAGVAIFREGAADSSPPDTARDVDGERGVFGLDGLPSGRFRVVVRPGGAWDDDRSCFVEATATVELRQGAESALEILVEPAGRLSLGARTADGRWVAARCVLRRDDGTVVPIRTRRLEVWRTAEVHDALSPAGPVVLSPALRPGTYVAECSLDGTELAGKGRFEVRAGGLTEGVVELASR